MVTCEQSQEMMHSAIDNKLASGNTGLGLFFAETIAQLHVKADKQDFIITDNNSQFGGARFKLYLP